MLVFPSSSRVYTRALAAGYLQDMMQAGPWS
jgi:hypothetical protein